MNKIKEIRKKKGMSQQALAAALNVDRPSVSKWENGIKEPRPETLKKIAAVLGCSYSDLIDNEGSLFKTWLDNVLSALVEKGEIASFKRIDDSRLDLVLYDDNDKNIKHTYLINTDWFKRTYMQHMEDARNDVLKIINDFIKF